MNFKTKKPILICYKNCSNLYGQIQDVFKLKKERMDNFKINISNQKSNVTIIKYNLNVKKILKLRGNSFENLFELLTNLNKKQFSKILNQEIKRKHELLKKFHTFSIFISEIEEVPLNLNYKMNFLLKIDSITNKNFFDFQKKTKYSTSSVFPLFHDTSNEFGKTIFFYFFLSKIFFDSSIYDTSIKTFRKVDLLNLKNDTAFQLKWFYPIGLVFRCSLFYILIPSISCKEFDYVNKIYKKLQFLIFRNISLKYISSSVLVYLSYHEKIFKIGGNFISNYLKCRAINEKQKNRIKVMENGFGSRIFFDRISNMIVDHVYHFIDKKFSKLEHLLNKKRLKRIVSNFHYILLDKTPQKTNFKIKYFSKNLDEKRCFGKLADNFFKIRNEKLFFFFNLKFLIFKKKTLFFLKKISLFNQNNYSKPIFVFLKLEGKKLNLEIGIVSPKNFVGSNINLRTSYHIKPTTIMSIVVKSEWKLFRVPISNRMVEEMRGNIVDLIITMLKNYGINLNVITNFFIDPVEKSLKKSGTLASYGRLEFFGKKFELNYIHHIYLKFRIVYIFFMFYFLDHSKNRSLKVFSIFRKLFILKIFCRKYFTLSLITGLINWIKKNLHITDPSKKNLLKSPIKKFKEKDKCLNKIKI
jgi:hypothetical protein